MAKFPLTHFGEGEGKFFWHVPNLASKYVSVLIISKYNIMSMRQARINYYA